MDPQTEGAPSCPTSCCCCPPPVRGALCSSRPRTIRAPLRSSASSIVRSLVHTGQIADLRQIHMRGGRLNG
ncbi:hypothetical protein BO79DRAFT_32157 [Aspergillus costaricaensis CBS 115574]|uniref:uncharacterized protein n=1 Tax=Aspergillus costaricaensis CBS 115574 TaxID=1448317 RepID=UPI000DBDAD54|nr:hypothetical protein BO79DRAFT_32157 [Aspergillus costaricaensis CBS 115574]RAK87203.1 hypothetical protein BO79DRAFT_32157 [Aspergillus costaricaensis CBS 115574]